VSGNAGGDLEVKKNPINTPVRARKPTIL
jgi:hypothetical protein